MGIRRSCLALAVALTLLVLPTPAWADRHNWEMCASASSVTGSVLWGGTLSLARTVYKDKHGFHRSSVFGEFAKHGGPHDGGTLTQTSALIGYRFVLKRTLKMAFPLTPNAPEEYRYRLQVFVQGAVAGIDTSRDKLRPSVSPGAGVDFLFSEYGGLRGQADWVPVFGAKDRDKYFRFSLGVIYRFEHPH